MFAVVAGLGGLLVVLGVDPDALGTLKAAVALPLLLMVGLGSLLLILTLMVAVLDRLNLTDRRRAFGLPDGSMQAVIALSLVLIFIIASLYLFSALPNEAQSNNELARNRFQFAQQLLTTVGTLAVAVAGFYFGTRSVEAARIATTEAARTAAGTSLEIRWPSSPATLAAEAGAELSPIVVEVAPAEAAVTARVLEGDPDGEVVEVAPRTYKYVRGAAAGDRVVLSFELDDRSARETLVVHAA